MLGVNNFDVFDVIGPIMIGPSSSHTAGAIRIGQIAGQLCNYEPQEITVLFHGSLASTYSTHKTDVGIVAGILGMNTDDGRIRHSIEIASNASIKVKFQSINIKNAHPSTIIIKLKDREGAEIRIQACSIGGGNILIEEINQYKVNLDGKRDCLFGRASITGSQLKKIFKDVLGNEINTLEFSSRSEYTEFKLLARSPITAEKVGKIKAISEIEEVILIKSLSEARESGKGFYSSWSELVEVSKNKDCSISNTGIEYEAINSGRTKEEVFAEMKGKYAVMKEAIKKGLEKEHELIGNIFKGNAAKMNKFLNSGMSLCGVILSKVIRNALAIMEVNGSMGKVVACPTAGSCGTVPAAVITIAQEKDIPEDKVVKALFTGAGIGMIIGRNASFSGAVGGCQAECGSASAMAAAILTEMFGGDYSQISSAISLAFGNILGLVCDPVAGLVEIPCIQRNTMTAANAIICSEMALAGVDSVIPPDEMIGAMDEVSKLMDVSLKDTLGAGMSNTPTARRIETEFFSKKFM